MKNRRYFISKKLVTLAILIGSLPFATASHAQLLANCGMVRSQFPGTYSMSSVSTPVGSTGPANTMVGSITLNSDGSATTSAGLAYMNIVSWSTNGFSGTINIVNRSGMDVFTSSTFVCPASEIESPQVNFIAAGMTRPAFGNVPGTYVFLISLVRQ